MSDQTRTKLPALPEASQRPSGESATRTSSPSVVERERKVTPATISLPDAEGPGLRVQRPVGQASALDQAHGEEVAAVDLADFVDGDNVRMIEAASGLGFEEESPHGVRAGQSSLAQHLEGDDAMASRVPRAIDDAHAAPGDLPEQFIVAEGAGKLRANVGCVDLAGLNRQRGSGEDTRDETARAQLFRGARLHRHAAFRALSAGGTHREGWN